MNCQESFHLLEVRTQPCTHRGLGRSDNMLDSVLLKKVINFTKQISKLASKDQVWLLT